MTIGIPKYSFLSKIFWIFWGFLGRKPKYKKLLISNDDKVSAEMIDIIQYKEHDFFKKGEFIIVVENLVKKDLDSDLEGVETLLKSLKKEGLTLKQSVNIVKEYCKISKKIIYNQALKVWNEK